MTMVSQGERGTHKDKTREKLNLRAHGLRVGKEQPGTGGTRTSQNAVSRRLWGGGAQGADLQGRAI